MDFVKMLSAATDTLISVGKRTMSGNGGLSRLDCGTLEIAMMVAALDGVIRPSETEAFVRLVRSCHGCTDKNFEEALNRALRSSGYIAAMAQCGLKTEEQRVAAFVDEAEAVMPRGFVDGDRTDVRRAFVTWISMAMSDGDYSGIERKAIEALKERFSDVKFTRMSAATMTWATAYPGTAASVGVTDVMPKVLKYVKLFEDDFMDKAESLLRSLADERTKAEADAALQELMCRP